LNSWLKDWNQLKQMTSSSAPWKVAMGMVRKN